MPLRVVVVALTGQLLLGAVIHFSVARLRRRAGWVAGERALCRAAPWLLALLALAALPQPRPPLSWPFLLLGALPTSGCFVTVHAAFRESRGQVHAARAQVRFAGRLTFVGALGLLAFVAATQGGAAAIVGMACIGAGAFVALLAGLSRKPRPSAYFAGLLYLAGVCAVAALNHPGSGLS